MLYKQKTWFFYAFQFILCIYIFTSCVSDQAKIALETTDVEKGLIAIEKVKEQTSLAKIALNGNLRPIRDAALIKIKDQDLILKVVLEAHDSVYCRDAVKKITNQNILYRMFMSEYAETEYSKDNNIKVMLITQLTDPSILLEIIFNSKNWLSRELALQKLSEPDIFLKIPLESNDKKTQSTLKFINALKKDIPESYRIELFNSTLPIICILNDSLITNTLGGIVSIKVNWRKISKVYEKKNDFNQVLDIKRIDGEVFSLSIKLEKLNKQLYDSWRSEFPEFIEDYETFIPVKTQFGNFFSILYENLPEDKLDKLQIMITDILVLKGPRYSNN